MMRNAKYLLVLMVIFVVVLVISFRTDRKDPVPAAPLPGDTRSSYKPEYPPVDYEDSRQEPGINEDIDAIVEDN